MTYTPAIQDQLLAIRANAGIAELAESERFAAAEPDLVEAIVEGVAALAAGEWAPLNRIGDVRRRRTVFWKQTYRLHRMSGRIHRIDGRTPLCPLGIVDLSQVQNRALDHPTTGANAFNDAPIAVLFSVLESRMTFQIHASIFACPKPPSTG